MHLFEHSRTRRMVLTEYRVSGPELPVLGVVEACVPQEELMGVAMDLARQAASKSPIAMRLAKRGLNAIEWSSLRDGYRFEQEMTAELGRHNGSREAMRAFLEKRPPEFRGDWRVMRGEGVPVVRRPDCV